MSPRKNGQEESRLLNLKRLGSSRGWGFWKERGILGERIRREGLEGRDREKLRKIRLWFWSPTFQ